MKEIKVTTGSKEYKVVIGEGVLNEYDPYSLVKEHDKCGIVVSERVYSLHRKYIDSLAKKIDNSVLIQYPDCEENKSYTFAESYFKWMLSEGFTRHSMLISIGGGVTGDFSGYLSSQYMRGIDIVQVPTTLLAMVDSSVGGKVAVNLSSGKNMVGAFHQPSMVIADSLFLSTLPRDEFKNGIAEMVKHALIGDLASVNILKSHTIDTITASKIIIPLIENSVRFKAGVVSRDEREGGVRAVLNYGHTIGHAIESLTRYKGVSHGQAVAIGLLVESKISHRLGLLGKNDFDTITSMIERYELMQDEHAFDVEDIMKHLQYDKKNVGNEIRFVLLHGLGKPEYDQVVDNGILRDILRDHYKR